MAIGRYTTPMEATYEPIPFEEITRAGIAKQARYDEAEALANQTIDKLYSAPAASFDRPAIEARAGRVEDQLGQLIQDNPDLASYEFRQGVNRLISDTARDPFYKQTAMNAQREQEYQKILQSNIPEHLKFRLRQEYDRARQLGTNEVGVLASPTAPKVIDVQKNLAQLGSGFIQQGFESGDFRLDEKTGKYIKTGVGVRGIDPREVGAAYGWDIKTDEFGNIKSREFVGMPALNADVVQDFILRAESDLGVTMDQDPEAVQARAEELYMDQSAPLVDKFSGTFKSVTETPTSTGLQTTKGKAPQYKDVISEGSVVHISGIPASKKSSDEYKKGLKDEINTQQQLLSNEAPNSKYSIYYKQNIEEANRKLKLEEEREGHIKKTLNYDTKMSEYDDEIFKIFSDKYGVRDDSIGRQIYKESEEAYQYWLDASADIKMMEETGSAYTPEGKAAIYRLKSDKKFGEGLEYAEEIAPKTTSALRKKEALQDKFNDKLEEDSKTAAKSIPTLSFAGYDDVKKQIETHFVNNKVAYTAYETTKGTEDANEPVSTDELPELEFTNFSVDYVPEKGYILQAKEKVQKQGVTGSKKEPRTFTLTTESLKDLGKVLGMQVAQRNTGNQKLLNSAFTMVNPGFAPQINSLRSGQTYTIYEDNNPDMPQAKVQKVKKPGIGGEFWKLELLNPDGSVAESYGGESGTEGVIETKAELYNALNAISSGKYKLKNQQ